MIKREKNQFCVTVRQNHRFLKNHDFLNVIVSFSNFCLLIKTAWKPGFFWVISWSVSSGYQMKSSHSLLIILLIHDDIIKKMSLERDIRLYRKIERTEFWSEILPINRTHSSYNNLKFSAQTDASFSRYWSRKKTDHISQKTHKIDFCENVPYLEKEASVWAENFRLL